jgi:hypothetical protein
MCCHKKTAWSQSKKVKNLALGDTEDRKFTGDRLGVPKAQKNSQGWERGRNTVRGETVLKPVRTRVEG